MKKKNGGGVSGQGGGGVRLGGQGGWERRIEAFVKKVLYNIRNN